MSGVITGSNETLNEGAGASINLAGSNDTLDMANGDYVGVLAGTGNTINMSSGSIDTLNLTTVSSILLDGSNDVVDAGTDFQVNVNGSTDVLFMANGDYVGLLAGNDDTVILTGGMVDTLNNVTNIILNGSNDTVGVGSGGQLNVNGSNDALFMANGDYVGLLAGNGDTVILTGGLVDTQNNVTNIILNGSNDTVGVGSGGQLNVEGSNDGLYMANGDYVGLMAGSGDAVIMNGGTLNTLNNVTGAFITGSNNVVATGSGNSIDVTGNSNVLNMSSSAYVGIISGTGNVIYMTGGTLNTLGTVTATTLNGSNDVVSTGTSNSLYVNGSNNTITIGTLGSLSLLSGGNDSVNMSSGTIAISSGQMGITVTGSHDTITAGASVGLAVAVGTDTITMGTLGSLTLLSGGNDAVNMSNGTLSISSGQSGISVTGSHDTVTAATSDSMNVAGSSNTLNMGTGSYVGLLSGTANTINMSNGSVGALANIVGNTVNGSNNIIATPTGNSMNVSGSNNTINMGSGSYVGLLSGNADTVNMSNGSMATLEDVTNIQLNGSNDTVIIGAGASINVNGTGDVINAAEGSTVTLSAGDSGDTINMYGGTIVLGANLSNITINGTGDHLSGPDASVAGPVTLASTIITGGNFLTGYTTETVPAYTPPVIYYAGDIQDLVGYFEANPNLSQDQIQAAESDSNYDTNVATYLNTANISAMQPNVLGMLDGYSSLYLALMGVPATALQEEDEIDQDFSWGSSQAQVPSDGMLTMLQNLLPALLDTNATTKQDVSDALECLANAAADPTPDNIIVTDTAAKLLFEMAEQPDNAKTAPLTEPYQVSLPGLTGPYEIAVQPTLPFGDAGSNEMIYIKNEDGGFWGEFWNDLDSYVVPIVDAAAAVTGNFEIILAASALDAVEAGQDFASGQDLQGVFNVVAAVGGALDAIGSAAQQAEESAGAEVTDATSNAEVALGSYLSDGVSVAEGIDGIVNGAQTGNALAIVTSALGGVSGIAALGGDSSLQQFASVGASLAASAQQLGSGNILEGLASLVEAAQTSGVLQSVEQGIESLFLGFNQAIYGAGFSASGVGSYSSAGSTEFTWGNTTNQAWGSSVFSRWQPGDYIPIYNASGQVVGISYLDPQSTGVDADPTNNPGLMAAADAVAQNITYNPATGQPNEFLVVGHGNSTGISDTSNPSTIQISPQSVETAITSIPNLNLSSVTPLILLACNTSSPNTNQTYYNNGVPDLQNGNEPGVNFAQTLADTWEGAVIGFNGLEVGNSGGYYIVDGTTSTSQALTDLNNAITTYKDDNGGSAPPVGSVFASDNGGSIELVTPNANPVSYSSVTSIIQAAQNAQSQLWPSSYQ